MMAGRMRYKLTFQSPVRTRSDVGSHAVTWNDFLTTWGDIRTLRGGERLEAMRQELNITHRIYIRYRPGIKPNMRISTSCGRTFYITSMAGY